MPFLSVLPHTFAPVPEDEMAFALAYFVAAASQSLGDGHRGSRGSPDLDTSCNTLFGRLYATARSPDGKSETAHCLRKHRTGADLSTTFRAVCTHYHGSEHIISICARVLGFYLLMERTQGGVLAGLVETDPADERYISLPHGVVRAIASFPLGPSISISPVDFLNWTGPRTRSQVEVSDRT